MKKLLIIAICLTSLAMALSPVVLAATDSQVTARQDWLNGINAKVTTYVATHKYSQAELDAAVADALAKVPPSIGFTQEQLDAAVAKAINDTKVASQAQLDSLTYANGVLKQIRDLDTAKINELCAVLGIVP